MSLKRYLSSAAVIATIATSPLAAKSLVFCSDASPEGFDPALYTSVTTFDASSRTIFNRIVEFETGTTNVVPGLAESWEVSHDKLEYTFHLRKGVKFHSNASFTPSRDFNADDVLFSFNRQRLEDHPYHSVAENNWSYFEAMGMSELIADIIKVDDYTVKLVLNRPEAPMMSNLAMDFASIQSKEYADQMLAAGTPEKLNQAPIGTGPFVFVTYQKDAVIRYEANPDYWEGASPLDTLIFAITPDASVRYQRLKADECQIMPYPNPADIQAIQNDPELKVLTQEGLNVGYLAYNTLTKPFDDPRVRKALNMAVDKNAIIEVVYQGSGQIAKNPLPPTIWSYNDAVTDEPYDPEAAKALLKEAGIKDLTMKLWAMPVSRAYNPNARRMAEMMQADFDKVGVTAEIVSYEWGEYLSRSKAKDRDGAALLGWIGDNGDPDNFLSVLLGCDAVGGSNAANWCFEPYDELIQKAKTTSDKTERTRLYKDAQIIAKEQAPMLNIAHSVDFMPMSQKVDGYKIHPMGTHIFYGVDIQD
ncbi:ABC transporter substrate-binding protein [Sulfitobacter dubius]|uniref:ABC transporter substrate-binding protein n=1 Tax=Sulfitobacter dubius TaxID=218673 RepID=UPI002943A82D|nr:ABC transporter substrate-binding protein [Sulfitobacter dubius]WOI30769.1 ABC transporter substrate-binding protein [Sulfitobacter dubius]